MSPAEWIQRWADALSGEEIEALESQKTERLLGLGGETHGLKSLGKGRSPQWSRLPPNKPLGSTMTGATQLF